MPIVPSDLGIVHMDVLVRLGGVFTVNYDDVENVHVLEFLVLPPEICSGSGEIGITKPAIPEG